MAYDSRPITTERVKATLELLSGQPRFLGIKQSELLDALRGKLEYYDTDYVEGGVLVAAAGDVIPRPHEDLENVLKEMRAAGSACFVKPHGWRLR